MQLNRSTTALSLTILMLSLSGTAVSQEDAAGSYLGKQHADWIKQAESESGDARRRAYYALGRIQPPTAETAATLAAGLQDGEVVGRRYAMSALSRMGPLAAPHLKEISEAIKGEQVNDTFIRLHGIRAMAAVGDEAKSYAPQLRSLLSAPQGNIQAAAASALWQIEKSPSAVTTLLKLSSQTESQEGKSAGAFEAVVALAKIGDQHEAVLPALLDALTHENEDIRRAAVDGIGKYEIDALAPLAAATHKLEGAKSIDATMAAGRIFDRLRTSHFHSPSRPLSEFKNTAGSVISKVTPAVVKVLTQPQLSQLQRRQVAFQLARLGEVGGFPLLKLLATDDADVRAAVIAGMQQLEIYLAPQSLENMNWVKQQLVKPMLKLLDHPSAEVRLASVRLFAALKTGAVGADASGALKRILRQPADSKAHPYAARALAALRE